MVARRRFRALLWRGLHCGSAIAPPRAVPPPSREADPVAFVLGSRELPAPRIAVPYAARVLGGVVEVLLCPNSGFVLAQPAATYGTTPRKGAALAAVCTSDTSELRGSFPSVASPFLFVPCSR